MEPERPELGQQLDLKIGYLFALTGWHLAAAACFRLVQMCPAGHHRPRTIKFRW